MMVGVARAPSFVVAAVLLAPPPLFSFAVEAGSGDVCWV